MFGVLNVKLNLKLSCFKYRQAITKLNQLILAEKRFSPRELHNTLNTLGENHVIISS
jgi:hypothetical protein